MSQASSGWVAEYYLTIIIVVPSQGASRRWAHSYCLVNEGADLPTPHIAQAPIATVSSGVTGATAGSTYTPQDKE